MALYENNNSIKMFGVKEIEDLFGKMWQFEKVEWF